MWLMKMRSSSVICCLVGFVAYLCAVASASDSEANPLEKVIELLNALSKGIEKEGTEDANIYKAFTKWYNNETETGEKIMKSHGGTMEQMKTDLKEAEAFRAGKSKDLVDLANKLAKNGAELTAGRTGRKEERALFEKNEATFLESIDQLERVLVTMNKKAPAGAASAASASLLSVSKNLKNTLMHGSDITLSTAQREILDSFMRAVQATASVAPSFLQTKSRGPYGEFQSGSSGLITTLTDLKGKVQKERDAAIKAEETAKKEFQALESGLITMIENGEKSKADIKSSIAQSQEQSSKKQALLQESGEIFKAQEEHQKGVETEYRVKTQAYKIRLGKRADESIAVHEANRILSSDVSKSYIKKQTIGTVGKKGKPKGKAASFLQLSQKRAAVRRTALRVLKSATTPGLAALAVRSSLHFRIGADPFAKVKSMLEGMLKKLNDKQAEESKHASWCDSEMTKTTMSKTRKEEDVQKMKDRLDALRAELTQTKAEMAEANKDLQEVNTSLAEAMRIRRKEKEGAGSATKQYQAAYKLLQRGLKILKGYYENKEGGGREVDKKEFKDRHGMGMGIIALLEIAVDDFKKLYREAKDAEEVAERDFEDMQAESQVRVAVFQKDLEWNTRTKVKLEFDEATMANDLKSYQNEVTAIDTYMDKLKASCIVKGPSYAERKARREAELTSLKEALAALNAQ
jgi:hypothetical protein